MPLGQTTLVRSEIMPISFSKGSSSFNFAMEWNGNRNRLEARIYGNGKGNGNSQQGGDEERRVGSLRGLGIVRLTSLKH
jgi:hypothetical protein